MLQEIGPSTNEQKSIPSLSMSMESIKSSKYTSMNDFWGNKEEKPF